jgi:diguanylate cyclase (GGDEF)-like protein
MQDLDDGVRIGRGRLSAIPDATVPKVQPFIDEVAVVPGHRLLDMASALSDGATVMHARLRHLEPDERDAILDLMAAQLSTILSLWTDLVRGVVVRPNDTEGVGSAPPAGDDSVDAAPGRSDRRQDRPRPRMMESAPTTPTTPTTPVTQVADSRQAAVQQSTQIHPSAQGHDHDRVFTDHGGTDARGPEVYRLPRRHQEMRAGDDDAVDRDLWTPPLRSVRVQDTDDDYEGDRLIRDELTGVFNRQAGFAALGRELDRCRRAGERFVLGYLNVDGLKEVNSRHGSLEGDELLRKVTAALRATLRSYDVIMRLGGDEFLFSLPGADMATAELRANEFNVILAEEAPGGSASVGFGELRGNDTLDEIISRAEMELVKNRRSRVRPR